jgi:hypothetical protein
MISQIVKPMSIRVDFFLVAASAEFLIVQMKSINVATVVSAKVSVM